MDTEKLLAELLETATDKAKASESLNAIREKLEADRKEKTELGEKLHKAEDLTKRLEQVNRELFLKIPITQPAETKPKEENAGIGSLFE